MHGLGLPFARRFAGTLLVAVTLTVHADQVARHRKGDDRYNPLDRQIPDAGRNRGANGYGSHERLDRLSEKLALRFRYRARHVPATSSTP